MFCAPEMFSNTEYDPFKADIWALGITFYYMVTGIYPFTENDVDRLKNKISFNQIDFYNFNVDPQIKFLIMKMTSKNPLFRYSAHQLLKLDLFKSIENNTLTKSASAMIRLNMRRKSISHLTFANDETDEIIVENEKTIKKKDNVKLGKIHSLHGFNANLALHKHFIQYE